jgi:hypothetical protein
MMKKRAIINSIVWVIVTILIAGCIQSSSEKQKADTTSIQMTPVPESPAIPTDTEHQISIPKSNSYIIINPVSVHHTSDVFEINGTTNLPIDSKIQVHFFAPFHTRPLELDQSAYPSPTINLEGFAKIMKGNRGENFWSFQVNISGIDTYSNYVTVVSDLNNRAENFTDVGVFLK